MYGKVLNLRYLPSEIFRVIQTTELTELIKVNAEFIDLMQSLSMHSSNPLTIIDNDLAIFLLLTFIISTYYWIDS